MADWKASYTIRCQEMTIALDEQLMTWMYALGGTTGSIMNHNISHVMGLTTNITMGHKTNIMGLITKVTMGHKTSAMGLTTNININMGHKTSFMGIMTRRKVGKRPNGPYDFIFKS